MWTVEDEHVGRWRMESERGWTGRGDGVGRSGKERERVWLVDGEVIRWQSRCAGM